MLRQRRRYVGAMRRVTVTIPDDLETALDRFIEAQPVAPSVTAVLQTSLKHFLEPSASAGSADLLNRVLRSRRRVVEIAHAKGASNVRVFGSVARGEARNDSDIDILITAVPGTSLFDVADLQMELEQLLNAPVHVSTDGGMTDEQREAVDAEAIAL